MFRTYVTRTGGGGYVTLTTRQNGPPLRAAPPYIVKFSLYLPDSRPTFRLCRLRHAFFNLLQILDELKGVTKPMARVSCTLGKIADFKSNVTGDGGGVWDRRVSGQYHRS